MMEKTKMAVIMTKYDSDHGSDDNSGDDRFG